jgi:pimeloyl-ACP methyl ester carboxylesterase
LRSIGRTSFSNTPLNSFSLPALTSNWTLRANRVVSETRLELPLRREHGPQTAWLEAAFGDPYTNRAAYEDRSPITYIRSCRTPTLLLHGQNDSGVPVGQAYEFHVGLKGIGVETELVIYPREGHAIQERGHQEDLQRRVLEWFDRHVKGTSANGHAAVTGP